MRDPRQTLAFLRSLGARLEVAEGRLRVSAAKGVMTPELKAELAANREGLLELLRGHGAKRGE